MINETYRILHSLQEIKGFVPSAKLPVPKDARGTWSTGNIRKKGFVLSKPRQFCSFCVHALEARGEVRKLASLG